MPHALLLVLLSVGAQSPVVQAPLEAKPEVRAVRASEPVTIDGILSEPTWRGDRAVSSFTQRDPLEGAPATETTEVRVAYDDEALYVGARMHDSAPGAIVARLGRRDAWLNADAFVFYVDPYHDGRSGFFFSVSAGGTLRDGTLFNDDWDDDTWDGVWEGRARIDADGWTAEMRIPYSQLRFRRSESYRWGVNFRRYVGRKAEDDYLAFTPKTSSGFVSRFPDLVGIEGIAPPRRVSFVPYAITKAEFTGHQAGDPFNDGSRYRPSAGADLTLGLGSNLTLDATVNPDFGQVEVDPAVVNLSDVETFFQEKRPFFVEGSSLFSFGRGGATNYWNFNWPNPDFFYSRRIGRSPQGSLPDAEFADSPAGVRILGAGKLTGKIADRWSLGMLHALTARETADLEGEGGRFRAEVEPAGYYGVLRAQREFAENRHGLGFISTLAASRFDDDRLRDQIDSRALALGVDGWTFLDGGKAWVVTGWAGLSQVSGNPARITDLQRSPQHYFQRPDAGHVRVDPAATSLRGYAGRVWLNKEKGSVTFNAAFGLITPGFDVNDVGFLWRADTINAHVGGGYRWTRPGASPARPTSTSWPSRATISTATGRGRGTSWWVRRSSSTTTASQPGPRTTPRP